MEIKMEYWKTKPFTGIFGCLGYIGKHIHFLHYKINHSFYYNNVTIDDNTYIDQQNVHLIGSKHYP